ncbi:hypothetical protein SLH49_14980 [Cognatiyoonia sp. IB215446]|nr:hypothetical protein [Cognatiyoonia sp. IB215446]
MGGHKTATTSFQRFLKINSQYFEEQYGLRNMLPEELRTMQIYKLISLARAGRELSPDDLETARTEARDWFNDCSTDNVILSHEGLVGQHNLFKDRGMYPGISDACAVIADAFQDVDITAVFVIRSQAAFLESTYMQAVHYANYMPFDEYVEGIDMSTLSWKRIADVLYHHFGRENVEVIPFEAIKQGEGAFFSSLLKQILPGNEKSAVDGAVFEDSSQQNASLSDTALRIVGRAAPLTTKSELKDLIAYLRKNFSNRTHPRASLCSPDLKRRIKRHFTVENQQVFEDIAPEFHHLLDAYIDMEAPGK